MGKTGNFNLNFPGAQIVCDSEEKRTAVLDFLNGKSDFIEIAMAHDNSEEDILRAVFNTTYLHEGKHLHDHLICPMLLHNYTLKLTALFYASLALQEWQNGNQPYKYVPLPFTTWIELAEEKKLELIRNKGISTSDVPLFSLQDAAHLMDGHFECDNIFTKALLLAALHYSEYECNVYQNSPDGYNTELSVRTFTESMAYVQQVTEMALRYGAYGESLHQKILDDSFKHFMKLGSLKRDLNTDISSHDYIGYSVYTAAFTMIWRYVKQTNINPNYTYPFIAYVLFWALSGNVLLDKKQAVFPRNRLERLFNLDYMGIDLALNIDTNLLELFQRPLQTFQKWDEYIGSAYAGTNINILSAGNTFGIGMSSNPVDFNQLYNKFMHSYMGMVQHLASIGLSKPANYIYNIANAAFYMTNLFKDNPSTFLYPEAYSNHLTEFVNVPFRIEFQSVAPITREECSSVRKGVAFKDKYIYGNSFKEIDNANIPTLDWSLYVDAVDYIDFTDALFGKATMNLRGSKVKNNLPGIKPWLF